MIGDALMEQHFIVIISISIIMIVMPILTSVHEKSMQRQVSQVLLGHEDIGIVVVMTDE